MAFCIAPSCWSNGIYKLPDAIYHVWFLLFGNWHGLFWHTGIPSIVLCGSSRMDHSNYLESYLASLFPLWSIRMALAKLDLLEKTTIQKKQLFNRYNGNGV